MRYFVMMLMVTAALFGLVSHMGAWSNHDHEIMTKIEEVSEEFDSAFYFCARLTYSGEDGLGDYRDACFEDRFGTQVDHWQIDHESKAWAEYETCRKREIELWQRAEEHPCWPLEDVLCRRDKLREQLELSTENTWTWLALGPTGRMLVSDPWYGPNPYDRDYDWTVTPHCWD